MGRRAHHVLVVELPAAGPSKDPPTEPRVDSRRSHRSDPRLPQPGGVPARASAPALLRATGRPVIATNLLAVARYRDRHSVARRKSDARDALVLAHILRTDLHAHRPLRADSDQARAIAVLARAQQDDVDDGGPRPGAGARFSELAAVATLHHVASQSAAWGNST
jgi:Transposase